MNDLYRYRVLQASVVDGDTVDLELDVGFRHTLRDRFRLYGPDPNGRDGLNAPELTTIEGKLARDFLLELMARLSASGAAIVARTLKSREKYGRWLAVLYAIDDAGGIVANVNAELIAAGHATLKRY